MRKLLRFLCYLAGLSLLALGNVCSILSGLGVTATASVGYVLSELLGMTMGTATIITFALFIAAQLAITDKKNYVQILLQLPFSVFFSYILDLLLAFVKIDHPSAAARWLLMAAGILLTSVGVVCTVGMRIVPTAPDGIVQTITERFGFRFGNVKNIFDLLTVLLAGMAGLCFRGRLLGIGVGTVISALLIGRVVKLLEERFGGMLEGLAGAGNCL